MRAIAAVLLCAMLGGCSRTAVDSEADDISKHGQEVPTLTDENGGSFIEAPTYKQVRDKSYQDYETAIRSGADGDEVARQRQLVQIAEREYHLARDRDRIRQQRDN